MLLVRQVTVLYHQKQRTNTRIIIVYMDTLLTVESLNILGELCLKRLARARAHSNGRGGFIQPDCERLLVRCAKLLLNCVHFMCVRGGLCVLVAGFVD